MRISLYLDEDSHSSSLIHALRYRGLDVTTAGEAQMLGSTDLEQLDWATAHGRVLYSFNIRDFACTATFLHRASPTLEWSSRNSNCIRLVNRCVDCSSSSPSDRPKK